MLEVILLLVALVLPLLAMAAKRSTKGLIGVPVNLPDFALGTLGSETVIANDLVTGDSTNQRRTYWFSFKGYISSDNVALGQGPIEIGVAHSDLSVTEIAEALDAAASVSQDNVIENERARRPVRSWGIFTARDITEWLNNRATTNQRFKIGFSTGEDFEPVIWARNHSGAVLTTGGVVNAFGKLWGRHY